MAEVTAMRSNALPYPVYGVPYVIVFPLLDADGDPVTGATCDSEVSKNGDTGADCTNEGVEITYTTATNKGMYYLILTATEMTADIVAVTIYSATSKATCIVLYPRKLVELASGTAQGGAAGYITLAASTVLFDNQYSGCLCVGTLDTNVEARILGACTASNQQCSVVPDWNTTPDADDTYKIYLPEGVQIQNANLTHVSGTAQTAGDICGKIGTPANIDSGGATLADNLKKIADDNGGADFDATTDSLQKIRDENVTEFTAIKGATWSASTDTLEAIRDRGDAAWITATSVAVSDKTGFSLASTGLDAVATTAATGVASNFREMLVQVWRRFFSKATRTSTQIKTYADNGTSVLTTQTISDDGTTETQGAGS